MESVDINELVRRLRSIAVHDWRQSFLAYTSDTAQEAADTIERLVAEREWRPIETAPKDGNILGYSWKWGVSEIMCHADGTFSLATFNGSIKYAHPTHWMPLPAPPQSPDARQEERR